MQVYCDMVTDGGGWSVFQRRQDGSVNFYRNWIDYANGFGNFTGEFWLGLGKINRLTQKGFNSLRVEFGDFDGNAAYAKYSTFSVGDSTTEYTLTVGGHSGTARDSLIYPHNGRKFSTKDNDNDNDVLNCPVAFHGAWWYHNCLHSNLNGKYYTINQARNSGATGVIWRDWKGDAYSLKFTEMKTRRNN